MGKYEVHAEIMYLYLKEMTTQEIFTIWKKH